MPKVHFVKAARKPIESAGVKVGDSYYWWKFRFGGRRVSKTKPKRYHLTQSDFLQTVYFLAEQVEGFSSEDRDDIESQLDDFLSQVQDLKSDLEDRLNNMPEHLQMQSQSGELLTERIDTLDEWISNLEAIEIPDQIEREDGESDEEFEERQAQFEQELADCCQQINDSYEGWF